MRKRKCGVCASSYFWYFTDFACKIGDTVHIVTGVFAGYSGTIDSISEDKKQVTVIASTGRRSIPIQVDAKDICLAED